MKDGTRHEAVDRERAELKKVLASPLFSRAPALSRILTFICEKHFRGESDSIKEYSIAVEALGRPTAFDPGNDTIVRVEASRLRKRLRQYYEREGAEHPLRILLPESGYVPQFIARTEEASLDTNPPASANEPGRSWRAKPSPQGLGAGIVLIAASLLTAVLIGRTFPFTRTSAPSGARVHASVIEQSAGEDSIRILAGFDGPKFIDSLGHTWLADRYYSGGSAVVREFRRVYRTRSQEFYRTARTGEFQYDIPLKAGVYELHLHFVEPVKEETDLDSGGEQTSRFHVYVNDKLLLRALDVVADAFGPNVADERVFTDRSPASDGKLHLKFVPFMNRAHLTAIEILPGIAGTMRPVRIAASVTSVFDAQGNLWSSDHYSLGGRITRRGLPVENTLNPSLYGSERWGHFNYAIPAAPGSYRVTLKFAETYPARFRKGERVFDVYCNGLALLRNFDVFAEAGGSNRAIDKIFHGLRPDSQGKLVLSFVPVQNYAIVNAIEVVAE